jgi:hypothetical protein
MILALFVIAAAWARVVLRRRNQHKLEDTARMRAMHHWSSVLDNDEPSSESYPQYQERKYR